MFIPLLLLLSSSLSISLFKSQFGSFLSPSPRYLPISLFSDYNVHLSPSLDVVFSIYQSVHLSVCVFSSLSPLPSCLLVYSQTNMFIFLSCRSLYLLVCSSLSLGLFFSPFLSPSSPYLSISLFIDHLSPSLAVVVSIY